MAEKWTEQYTIAQQELEDDTQKLNSLKEYASASEDPDDLFENDEEFKTKVTELHNSIQQLSKLVSNNSKIRKEISKMKTGSVALVNQITTISKIRIYNPLHSKDVLGNIKVSDEILDAIDDKIKELYLGK